MSTVRLLVLGSILRRGVSHGYAVYGDITAWYAETWTNVKPGSIYHAMSKLESQGMLRMANSAITEKLGPSRTEYAVTSEGEAEFTRLLEAALVSSDIQPFSAGIAFMDRLSRERVVALLQQRRNALEQSASFLRGLPTDESAADPSRHPELIGVWVHYVENEAKTTERIIGHIQEGKYAFRSKIEGEKDR